MIPACLYSVVICSDLPDGQEYTLVGVYSGRSPSEAVGAAVLEWSNKQRHAEKINHINWDAAEYDQIAYMVAQCEEEAEG